MFRFPSSVYTPVASCRTSGQVRRQTGLAQVVWRTERNASGGQRRGVRGVRPGGGQACDSPAGRARGKSVAGGTRVRLGAAGRVQSLALHPLFRQVIITRRS